MRNFQVVAMVAACAAGLFAASVTSCQAADPPFNTFSIVAFDPATGDLGVAVASRVLGVGSVVPWARADVGAIATQSAANTAYGPEGLELLSAGRSARETLDRLVESDPGRDHRQAGIVDARGNVASFTGSKCLDWAGHIEGDHFAIQGNILTGEDVLKAMVAAFNQAREAGEGAKTELADWLVAALKAGENAGGDRRGKQSAALMVVRRKAGYGGNDRYIDLRVEDHDDPVTELARLLELHKEVFPGGHQNRPRRGGILFAGAESELVISEVSERAVRIQLEPLDEQGRPVPPMPSTVLVPFATSEKLRVREIEDEKELQVGRFRVTVKTRPLTVALYRADGTVVQELVLDSAASTNAGVSFRTTAPVLGLGEGAQQFDRRGALYPMEPGWGAWNRPVLGSVVPSPFIIGTEGWAMFAHRPEGQFDLRESTGRFIPQQNANGQASLDLFVMDLAQPGDALTEYDRLTGHAAMPPKWALGYLQSHRTLAGPEEPIEVARAFREKKLPCDGLIYLGTGYCTNGWNTGHGSLDFNTNAFVPENIAKLHDLDFKVVFHVNRAPRNLYGSFSDPPEAQPPGFLTSEDGQTRERRRAPVHIRDYWARHQDLFALGVDGWWPDDGDELPLEARLTRHRCYYQGPLQDRPNMRPWSLHRTGYAGSQRYGGWIWSGDIDGKWETLAAQVSVGLNHGLSLTPFWGTDTGGFYPTPELTGELYVRWFEFSAFCPLFRSHGRTWHLRLPWGWNTGEFGPIEQTNQQLADRSELHNAEVEPICRRYLDLRYQMLPYNYSLAREACDTGLPMMRAMWLHYPDDPEAVKLGDQYLWGRDLLVAPVVEKGVETRRVYLPEGTWFDWWTGEQVEGKRWIDRPVNLATLPLYVRAGAIIPLDPVRQFTSQNVSGPTKLRIFSGADGTFTLYDDDGRSTGYRDGSDAKLVWIRIHWADAERRLTLEPDERMKEWPGGSREFAVEIVGTDAASKRVSFRGERAEVSL